MYRHDDLPLIFNMARPGNSETGRLQDQLLELNERAQAIQNTADAEKRALTPAESRALDSIFDEFEGIERRLKLAEQNAGLSRPMGRLTEPNMPGTSSMGTMNAARGAQSPAVVPPGYKDFKNHGEFFQAVRNSSAKGGTIDPRLIMNAPTTTSSEGSGSDGGFLVSPQWSREVFQTVAGEESLLGLCNVVPVTGNTYVQIKDDGAPWQASGGVQGFWKGEEQQLTQSKVALTDVTKRLHKLTFLIPVTEELLEDAPMLDAYLRRKVAAMADFKIKLAVIQGSGAGQLLGILRSAALITVDAVDGQGTDTLLLPNISSMWSRLPPGSEKNAVWLAHKTIGPELDKLSAVVGLGGMPVFIPGGSVAATPHETLKGRPIIWTEACEPLGERGDLILCDFSQYQVILKSGGMRTDVSMHLWFDYDMFCYKFVIRIDGSPLWSAPVAARDAVNTYSPFIALAERA